MKLILVVLLCVPVRAQGAANPQQKTEEYAFPSEDRIQLLLTQSERAFVAYEQAVQQEAQMGGQIAAASKDREVLTAARELLARLKKTPQGFNAPPGFLLIGYLDDATRNMSLCMGSAGMESGASAMAAGNVSEGQRYLHLSQTCMDTSTLLYTVSESASNMYGEFLLAQDEMTKEAASGLEKCVTLLKETEKHKQ